MTAMQKASCLSVSWLAPALGDRLRVFFGSLAATTVSFGLPFDVLLVGVFFISCPFFSMFSVGGIITPH
jgi:hypothetical protein